MKTRHKRKITYWITAALWLIIAVVWFLIAVYSADGMNVVRYLISAGGTAVAVLEMYCYHRDKDKLER